MRPTPQLRDEVQGAHESILETRVLHWPDEAACAGFAARIAARLVEHPATADAFIELQGPLGTGKTTFARHLLRALGVTGRVKSPSYAVLEPYRAGALEISHFDFFRFDDPREWEDAGFREVFARPGLKLVEWPDKARGVLPRPDLVLHIEPVGNGEREVTVTVLSECGRELLA